MANKLLSKIFLALTLILLCAGLSKKEPDPSRYLIDTSCAPCVNTYLQFFFNIQRSKNSILSKKDPSYHVILLLLLANDVELNPGPSHRVYNLSETRMVISRTRNLGRIETFQKEYLFSVLTMIEPADYIGEDYCRGCWTPVDNDHEAVSCDSCMTWVHLDCSDMTRQFYEANINSNFRWTCNFCRKEDTLPENLIYVPMKNSLFTNHLPQPLSLSLSNERISAASLQLQKRKE